VVELEQIGEVNQQFYKDSDLKIGAYVNVYGRSFLLCDCDEFTKEYYRVKYGISTTYVIAYRLLIANNSRL